MRLINTPNASYGVKKSPFMVVKCIQHASIGGLTDAKRKLYSKSRNWQIVDNRRVGGRGRSSLESWVIEKGWTSVGDIQPIFVADSTISLILYRF